MTPALALRRMLWRDEADRMLLEREASEVVKAVETEEADDDGDH